MNKWEKELGIKYPECIQCGLCCTAASPSSPVVELLKKASEGEAYAKDFLNLFEPHKSIESIRARFPEFMKRAQELAAKSPKFKSPEQVLFYKCRFVGPDNTCMIYEDRPNLCREYPDTPFLLMHPGCGFENWSRECKEKYKQINDELKALKLIQKTLSVSSHDITITGSAFPRKYFLFSPGASWLK